MSNTPPPSNPVLTAYESFENNTPLVTRYITKTLTISYILSFIYDPGYALSNIPFFTLHRFEVYRIFTSHFICAQLISLIFAYLSFTESAKRLEYSIGSTAFLTLSLTMGTLSNILFLIICETLYFVEGNQIWLLQSSEGIWVILFGLIAIECCHAPTESKRRLFFFEIPTLYYPIGLLVFFSLLAGVKLSWGFSVGIGYAYGYGYCDFLKCSSSTFRAWEDGFLRNFTTRKGWVVGHAASGEEAWSGLPTTNPITRAGNSLFSASENISTSNATTTTQQIPKETGFPNTGGRTLGSVSSRANSTDARAARLAALEKQTENKKVEEEDDFCK